MTIDDILRCRPAEVSETSIQRFVSSGKKLAVFGCGQGLKTLETFVLNKFGIKVDLYIDHKFQANDEFNGTKAINADGLASVNASEFHVIVTIAHDSYSAVEQQLSQFSFASINSAFDLYEYHLAYIDRQSAYSVHEEIAKHFADIQAAFALLSDDESKSVFEQLLRIYGTRNVGPVTCRPLSEQYLSSDIGLTKGYKKTINCGAYDGDTVKNINAKHGRFDFLACLEPDLENFRKLSKWLGDDNVGQSIADQICLYPLAVGAQTMPIKFESAGTNSNIVTDAGQSNALCVRLDDVIFRDDITFINMDVEGNELDALKGAMRILNTSKPDLAISIYHRPSDLWDIILHLNSSCAGYKFAIRNYTGFPAETVLYATQMG